MQVEGRIERGKMTERHYVERRITPLLTKKKAKQKLSGNFQFQITGDKETIPPPEIGRAHV